MLSLLFASKAGTYPGDALLKDRLLALSANIRLYWKGLPGTKTVSYYEHQ